MLGHGDIEFEHGGWLRQLASHTLSKAQRSPCASKHHVGALFLSEFGDTKCQRSIGENASDHDVFSGE